MQGNVKWSMQNGRMVKVPHPAVPRFVYIEKLRNLQAGQLHYVINSSRGFLDIGVKLMAGVHTYFKELDEIERGKCKARYVHEKISR